MYYIARQNTDEREKYLTMFDIPQSVLDELTAQAQDRDDKSLVYIPEDTSQSYTLIRQATPTEAFFWTHRNSTMVVSIDGNIGELTIRPCISEGKVLEVYFQKPYTARQIELWTRGADVCAFTARKATQHEVRAYSTAKKLDQKMTTLKEMLIQRPSHEAIARMEQELFEAKLKYRADAEKWLHAEDNWLELLEEYTEKTKAHAKELERYAYIDSVHVHEDLTVAILTKELSIDKIRGDRAEEYENKINLPIPVGVFEIELDLLGTQGVRIRSGHQEHPHISGESICLGNMRETCINALQQNDILTAMEIVHEVLTTFACDNPYWHCKSLFGID